MAGRSAFVALALLAGCGPGPDEFVPQYAEKYCEYLLECGDQAELTFDGITTVDDCLSTEGPAVDAQAAACKYKRGPAGDCLDAMDVVACPAEGDDVDAALPPACGEVFVNCGPIGDPSAGD